MKGPERREVPRSLGSHEDGSRLPHPKEPRKKISGVKINVKSNLMNNQFIGFLKPRANQDDFFLPRLSAPQERGAQETFFEVTISLLGIPCRQCGNIFGIFDNLLFLINLQISVEGTFDADMNFYWNMMLFINESLQKKMYVSVF